MKEAMTIVARSKPYLLTHELEADLLAQVMFKKSIGREVDLKSLTHFLYEGTEVQPSLAKCLNMLNSGFKPMRPKFNLTDLDKAYYSPCMRVYLLFKAAS